MGGKKIKMLVVGPVLGRFGALSRKLRALQSSKAGPFDVAFCVGPFFDGGGEDAQAKALLAGDGSDVAMPLPVVFVDAGRIPESVVLPGADAGAAAKDDDEIDLDAVDADASASPGADSAGTDSPATSPPLPPGIVQIAPSVYQLSSTGAENSADIINFPVPPTAHTPPPPAEKDDGPGAAPAPAPAPVLDPGPLDLHRSLTVAFVPPNARAEPETGVASGGTKPGAESEFQKKTSHPSYLGCDLLLTTDWGQGMASSKAVAPADAARLGTVAEAAGAKSASELGSYDIAELAAKCRPRYHFAPTLFRLGMEHSVASLPYSNPPRITSSDVRRNFHPSRFVALGPVLHPDRVKELGKVEAKQRKFVHALGLQPLVVMDSAELVRDVDGVVPTPYTDAAYEREPGSSSSRAGVGTLTSHGLSDATARRIMSESAYGACPQPPRQQQQFRWNGPGGKQQQQYREGGDCRVQSTYASDPTNQTLFLHGLNRDVTGGRLVNAQSIHAAMAPHGCNHVRFPNVRPGDHGHKTFCFLEFGSHQAAAACLESKSGIVEVGGVQLGLKWSSGTKQSSQQPQQRPHLRFPPPPPPGPPPAFSQSPCPPPPPPIPPRNRKRERLSEAEAADSTTLFVKLPSDLPHNALVSSIAAVAQLAQTALEDSINADGSGGDRITAETEPALEVSGRTVPRRDRGEGGSRSSGGKVEDIDGSDGRPVADYGFLEFASHAAASMALAAVTGNTDGGRLLDDEASKAPSSGHALNNTVVYWAHSSKTTRASRECEREPKRPRFAPDSRTDCWFCLASPACERHLILSIGDIAYVTMPKGPCNEHHALIVPVTHSSSDGKIGIFSDAVLTAEVEEIKAKLRSYASDVLDKDLFIYERAIPTKGGYHPHINCIPVDRGLGPKIHARMMSMATFDLRPIQNPDIATCAVLGDEEEWDGGYFYAEICIGGGAKDVRKGEIQRFLYKASSASAAAEPSEEGCKKKNNVPVQFGREVLASVHGNADLGHWKACVVGKDKEEDLAIKFRDGLGKYL